MALSGVSVSNNKSSPVSIAYFGAVGDGVTSCQAAFDAAAASAYEVIRFPAGVYVGNFANSQSGRTFIFEEGAIIDGVVHIAVGSGPDVAPNPGTITWVEDTRVIGTLTSTVRIGTYYAKRLNADKLRITPISASYPGQVANGGSSGVHLYLGSHDFYIGEIVVDSATKDGYGLGVDVGATIDADHKPTNITIGKYSVRDCTQGGLVTSNTVRLKTSEVVINSYSGNVGGFVSTSDEDIEIGRIYINGAGSAAARDGIYVVTSKGATFGTVEISDATQIGFRVGASATSPVKVGDLMVSGCGLDNVRLESRTDIGSIESTTAAQTGVNIPVAGSGCKIGRINSYSNTGVNVAVTAPNVSIREILTHTNVSLYGLLLNSTALNFKNDYIEAYGCSQGIRCLSAGPVDMGVMNLHDNTNAFVGSGMSAFSYLAVRYASNGANSNVDFSGLAGFAGTLYKNRAGENIRGDVDVSVTPATAKEFQVFGTPLTTNRTLTLDSMGAAAGDTFTVVRTVGATGASTLSVGGLKTLAVGQFCEVMWSGAVWRLTGFGSL